MLKKQQSTSYLLRIWCTLRGASKVSAGTHHRPDYSFINKAYRKQRSQTLFIPFFFLAMSSCCCCIRKMFLFSFVFYWNSATKTKLVKTHLFFACVSTHTEKNRKKDRKQHIPNHSEWEKFNVFWLAVHTPTIKKHKINISMCFLSFVLFHPLALAFVSFVPLYLLAPFSSFVVIGLFAHFPNTYIFQMLFDFLSLYHLSSSNANMSKSAVIVALCVCVLCVFRTQYKCNGHKLQ